MGKAGKRANGEDSIYRRKDGTWCGALTIGWDTGTGRQKRVNFYGDTRAEVADKLARAHAARQDGTLLEPNKVTVAQWLDCWLNDHKKMEVRTTTWESYDYSVQTHLRPAPPRAR